jgi:hypothetical protein
VGFFGLRSPYYIVRITRFPRESLADLSLIELKRSQVRFYKAEPSGYLTLSPLSWTPTTYSASVSVDMLRDFIVESTRHSRYVLNLYWVNIVAYLVQPSQSELLRPRLTALCRDCECSPSQFLLASELGTIVDSDIALMFSQDYHLST